MLADLSLDYGSASERLKMILGEICESSCECVRPEPLLFSLGLRRLLLGVNSLRNVSAPLPSGLSRLSEGHNRIVANAAGRRI